MHLYILDEHGNPLACDDTKEWARWFDAADVYCCEPASLFR